MAPKLMPHKECIRLVNALRAALDLEPIPCSRHRGPKDPTSLYVPEQADAWHALTRAQP